MYCDQYYCSIFFVLLIRRPPISTRTYPLFPSTTLFRSVYIHCTLVPFIAASGELKTKPTQHSVKELRSIGIQPDILLCRADREIPQGDRKKMEIGRAHV